jgi:hypothetical protein
VIGLPPSARQPIGLHMLRYAYFHDLNTGPKLLIWGGADDMARLYEALSQVADGAGPASLTDISGCVSADGSTVLLETVGEAEGIVRDEVEPDVFHWRVDEEGWYAFQEQVEPLTRCSPAKPGHQYLQCLADGEIVVTVACCEYSDDLKP